MNILRQKEESHRYLLWFWRVYLELDSRLELFKNGCLHGFTALLSQVFGFGHYAVGQFEAEISRPSPFRI